jgi:outer membrane receptor for ferrienterochelin and colicin
MGVGIRDLNNLSLRLIVIFLIVFQLIVIQNLYSQESSLKNKISIDAKEKPLKEILKEIEQKGHLTFSYSSQQINAEENVSLVARNKPIEIILSQLFLKTNIEYLELEKQIILKQKKEKAENKNEVFEEIKKYTLNGYIKDAENGEMLIGAAIMAKNKPIGTFTNHYGFFSISLPAGFYDFTIGYLGYKDLNIPINLNKNVQFTQNLIRDEKNLEVIVISASENENLHEINPLKKFNFTPITINCKPGINGETDLIQVLQSVPGIQSQSDGSVFFFTRGGNKDQNLILVDDAPIYNPSHLFGFFSNISPDAINDINIYKNYFPIQYGGRLSSIVDIRTKDGNMNSFAFGGNLSPLTNSFNIEGPLIRDKSSYYLGVRNSNINWLSNLVANKQSIRFNDIHAKLNFKINQKNKIYFSFYTGKDNIQYLETGYGTYAIKWQNFASTLRWNRLFSGKLFSNSMIYASLYDYYLYTSVEKDQYWNSLIGNISFKSNFSYYQNPLNTIRFGIEINKHFFNPGNLNDGYFIRKVSASNALEAIIYFGKEIKPSENFSLSYGIRLINWNNMGPTVSYSFDEFYNLTDTTEYKKGIFNTFINWEPRIDLTYSLNKSSIVKFSFNHQIQNLHLLSNSVSPFTTLDIWMPSSPNIKPQKMNQLVLSFYKKYTEFSFSVETYYKKLLNQIEYAENANMLLNPLIESQLRFGESRAHGIELSLKKQKGSLTGQLSYSYSKTVNQIKDINANKAYSPYYDKPHQLNLSISFKASERIRVNTNWIYSSGARFSEPSGFYYYKGYSIPYYEEKNNASLPDYHRMDFSASFRLNKNEKSSYAHYLSLTIINVYARKNPIAINFNKTLTEEGDIVVPANYITENQLIPSSIYLLGIAPTISYKFNFQHNK